MPRALLTLAILLLVSPVRAEPAELPDWLQTVKELLDSPQFQAQCRGAVATALSFVESREATADRLFGQKKYREVVRVLEAAQGVLPMTPAGTRARWQLAESYRLLAAELAPVVRDPAPNVSEEAHQHAASEFRRFLTKATNEFDSLARFLVQPESAGHLTRIERLEVPLTVAGCRFDLGQYHKALEIYTYLADEHKDKPLGLDALGGAVRCYAALGQQELLTRRLKEVRARLGILDEPARKQWEDWIAVAETPPPGRAARPTIVTAGTSANFRVSGCSARTAQLIADAAEAKRAALAKLWLGKELPNWPTPCDIVVAEDAGDRALSSFRTEGERVVGRELHFGGTLDHVLALQVPAGVMHALMADHFGGAVARWADTGLPTLTADATRQEELRATLRATIQRAGRLPVAPAKLLAAKEVPTDAALEFHALGHGLCEFLVQRKDRATLLAFVGEGSKGDWVAALKKHYDIAGLRELEDAWLATIPKEDPKQPEAASRTEPPGTQTQADQQVPRLVPVSLSPDGKEILVRQAQPVAQPVTAYVPEGNGYRPVTYYIYRTVITQVRIPIEGSTLRTARGKVLTSEELRERLKKETGVILEAPEEPLAEGVRQLLRDEVLILSGRPRLVPVPERLP
jgi:hypothetical protein